MRVTRREFLKGATAAAIGAAVVPSWLGCSSAAEEKPSVKLTPLMRRGIHVMTGGKDTVPAVTRLVGELAPALGLNWVILEINSGFAYQSHPECADENPMTKEDAKALVALARKQKIQLVPMYNCLGHQSWHADVGRLLQAHPEFNEAPEMDPNEKGFYCMSWCPSNRDVTTVVFDLFDELIDAFQAKAFHVGMDEVFVLGQCPRCKGTSNATLFSRAVNDLHGHLVGKRQVEMQMWGDRLLNGEKTGYGEWEASGNGTWQAIEQVPKDVVMCDWHYGLDNPDFPSIGYFQDNGFRVWPAGWNREDSIRRFIEVARQDDRGKMLGYLCTTWTGVNDVVSGLAGESTPPPTGRRHRGDLIGGVKLGAALANGKDVPVAPPPAPVPAPPAATQ